MLCNDSCRIQWVGQEDTYVGTDFISFGSHDKNWFKECIGSYQTLALRHYYLYFQLDMEIVRNFTLDTRGVETLWMTSGLTPLALGRL